MGLLERWDARNQETMEFHNETAKPLDDISLKQMVLAWLVASIGSFAVLMVLRLAGLSEDTAELVRIFVLVAFVVGATLVGIVGLRRRKRKWRTSRRHGVQRFLRPEARH